MTNFTTIAQVEAAETKDLIAFYNAQNPEKQVKKFADRQTAVKRVSALVEELNAKANVEEPSAADRAVAEEAEYNAQNEQPTDAPAGKWPFGKTAGDLGLTDSRSGDRREPTIEVPVEVKKAAITAAAAALLRKILGSNSEPVSKTGEAPEPESTDLWVTFSSAVENAPQRSAWKALVISGLATHNGLEGEKGAVQITEKGLEAFKSLPEGFGVVADIESRPLSHASNAAGVAASWKDPAVHAARLTRDGVTVTVDGKTTIHKSTREAFRFYRLMDSKHIRFRGILKAAKTATYEEGKKAYVFQIVGTDANTKFDESK